MKINIGVLFGGRSVEHEVSIISALQAIHAIDKTMYHVIPIYLTKQGIWYTGDALLDIENYKDTNHLLSQCKKILLPVNADENAILNYSPGFFQKKVLGKIDIVFPVFHGTHGEDGALQGLCELINIPFVGCDVLSSAVGMNKIAMKLMLKATGLPIVNYFGFYAKEWLKNQKTTIEKIENTLKYPMIVKPAALGSSIGITKASNRKELEEAVDIAKKLSQQLLVEEMISDLKEINCSVLGDYEKTEASVCEEPIHDEKSVLSFQDKYLSGGKTKGMSSAQRKLPADIPKEMSDAIQEMAQQTFLLLNCQGVARIDFLVDNETQNVYVNEINTIPGSLSFYLWEASGKSFTELTTQLIQLALKRHREKNNLLFSYDSNILAGFKGTKGAKT
ncbi:D-alanine--D-alanine ligase family protein [Candidatus Parabeggiatoa sp. HSG14]|uniref:D-alanine--D-alanine ligase family protein n=1 Tax=Candidatus Parabeggiatoa sp. HSG14 TaxID=3055593 RepID=UPI0025A6C26D|nr:D-alanine--D-alanine ligase family protein [Thiotrichales bacterium HSG14]